MTEMIERVARAFCEGQGMLWDNLFPNTKALLRYQARTAILAMREPTEAMMEAGAHPGSGGGPDECWMHPPEARTAWKAMIDAALSEP